MDKEKHKIRTLDNDKEIQKTLKLLEEGKEKIVLKKEDLVLVLANTGDGKSTFVQWLFGDNSQLIATEVSRGTGEFIITDGNKRISDATTKSKTVFPEQVIDNKTGVAYYDCPGFSDTRSPNHEIATTYFIKRVADHAKKIKLIFVIGYPSIRKGGDRQRFMDLIRHATDLIKDIDKFQSSIAMVVTKVDNQYIENENGDFSLTLDKDIIDAIADYLEEVKQGLEEKLSTINFKEKDFCENAIKFIEILLKKEAENYTRIGIFRRPNKSGPLSNNRPLQNGKKHIVDILNKKLDFTEKNNDDFGYTISDKSKNYINALAEKINEDVWPSVEDIVNKVKEHYDILSGQVRAKISSFINNADYYPKATQIEAQEFSTRLNIGYSVTSQLVEKTKNLTSIAALSQTINSSLTILDIHTCKDEILNISNQGDYFKFIQTVHDHELSTLPWSILFQSIEAYLSNLKKRTQNDIDSTVKEINKNLYSSVGNIVGEIEEYYQKKMDLLEIQKLPDEFNKAHHFALNMAQEVQTFNHAQELARKIRDYVIKLGADTSEVKKNIQTISNQGKYLRFLQTISNKILNTSSSEWTDPFNRIVKHLQESENFYKFLGDLYSSFSQYKIQNNPRMYNVATIQSWKNQPGQREIKITQANFKQFLDKTGLSNVVEHNSVRNIEVTEWQLRKLNQVLNFTLDRKMDLSLCSEPNKLIIKGDYIKFSDFTELDGRLKFFCKNGAKVNSIDIFALKTVFINADLKGIGDKLKVTIISPKWEVIGTRKIVLDGYDGIPHNTTKNNSVDRSGKGGDGEPGLPGGSAGSFFGIGSEFVNGESLTITANGGNGGSGQSGGDGARGKRGEDAKPLLAEEYYAHQYSSVDKNCSPFSKGCTESIVYTIFGAPGGNGGNGGNGGLGGLGGNAGEITLITFGDNTGLPAREIKKGNDGGGGYGGRAGYAGENGYSIKVKQELVREMFRSSNFYKVIDKDIPTYYPTQNGTPGINGANGIREIPEPAATIQSPAYIINNYKTYLRKNLNTENTLLKKRFLIEFFNQLDSNSNIKNVYDTLGLVNELQGLEEQYIELSKENLVIFYQSILYRVSEYAKSPKNSENSNQYKKVLIYLYTATLSKIYNLKTNSEPNLIIDTNKYLELIEKNIELLKILQKNNKKTRIVNQYKESYKINIDNKMHEARVFIKDQITAEIDNISVQIDEKIDLLIIEILELQKQVKRQKHGLIQKQEELQNTLVLRSIFSVFKIMGQVAHCLGPIGTAVGVAIESGSSIAESFVLDNQTEERNLFQLPPMLSNNLKSLETELKITKDKKVAKFNEQLEKIAQELTPHPMLNDTSKSIADIKKKIEDSIDSDKLNKLNDQLKNELKAKERELKTQKTITDQRAANAIFAIAKANQIIQLGTVGLDIYDKHKSDQAKLDAISEAIQKAEKNFQKFKQVENEIYNTIDPMLKNMRNNLNGVKNKLGEKSQVALDITKWRVQSAIKDIKLKMREFTKGLQVKDSLVHYIEKLEEAMTTLINIYDRLQNYQREQNLANYIASISSSMTNNIDISDKNLIKATDDLELTIRYNLLLRQYGTAINALKQWVFPCMDNYLEELTLSPPDLKLDSSTLDLAVDEAIKKITLIKSKIEQYKIDSRSDDQYFHSGEFSSNYTSAKPFFIWENKNHQVMLSKLLSGQEVVVKADVINTPYDQDAIKFNRIEFNFKLENETLSSELNDKLKEFKIRATHLGNSYYRYNDKVYVITNPRQTIEYTLEKRFDGEPVRSNNVYRKLKDGDLKLSPYAFWELQLFKLTKTDTDELKEYEGKVNLELVGSGSYVNKGACLKVEDYYEPSTTDNMVLPWLQDLDSETEVESYNCAPGAQYGQEYGEGFTCHTESMRVTVFLKESNVTLEKPEDTFSKQSCRPVEFNGHPSVYCSGEKTNVFFTREDRDPFAQLNGQLILLQVFPEILRKGKKIYSWFKNFFGKRTSEASILQDVSDVIPITAEEKIAWQTSLDEIENLLITLHADNKRVTELYWAWPILEDRKEDFERLSQQSQASVEEVNAFIENLQALHAELEVMNLVSTASSPDERNLVRKVEGVSPASLNAPRLNPSLSTNKNVSRQTGYAPWVEQGFFGATIRQPSMPEVAITENLRRIYRSTN